MADLIQKNDVPNYTPLNNEPRKLGYWETINIWRQQSKMKRYVIDWTIGVFIVTIILTILALIYYGSEGILVIGLGFIIWFVGAFFITTVDD